MATGSAVPRTDTGLLLLADISGYTRFLELVTAEHPEMTGADGVVPPAYPVLSSLLDVVVGRLEPTFTIADIEGDAVFAYAPDDRLGGDGAARLIEIVRSAYGAFRERVAEAMAIHKHDCQACMIFPSLELKFVVHHGAFVLQPIAGRERLLGPAVNVAHRLLKNSVTEDTGRRAYLLVTTAAAQRVELAPGTGASHVEHFPDVGTVTGLVFGLGS
jgi:hypothetical protein